MAEAAGVSGERAESVILRPQIQVVRVGMDLSIFSRMLWCGRPDHRQAIRIWKRQRAQEDGIDDTEDRAVRADPEGERDNGDKVKPGDLISCRMA